MKLVPSVLDLDWPEVSVRIERFVRDYMRRSGAKGIVMGLSGGVDSCTVAALSAIAVGGDKVMGLVLPEEETHSARDIEHAKIVAKDFGIETQTCDISPTLQALYRSIPIFDPAERVGKGNLKARTRMLYWYYYANKLNLLVCGSSDKSEAMMGYFTKWGDIAADIFPIMDLYKTQVRKVAQHIGIPRVIYTKQSTPALWPDQTAETELGIGFAQLDLVLYGLEHFLKTEEISQELGIEEAQITRVKDRWLAMEHKRRTLLTTKLEYRTVGMDFRLPRS